MSALAELVKNRKKKGILVPFLDEHLMMRQSSEDRRDKCFHPSDLSGRFCPRAWALYNYHPEGLNLKEAGIDPRLDRIFGNGHGVHHRIQGYFQGAGVLWGTYRKLVGWKGDEPQYEFHVGFPPNEPGWEYTEVGLFHNEDRILGSTDGLLHLHGKKYGLEIKSINAEGYQWALAKGEMTKHKEQTFVYAHCLEYIRKLKLAGDLGGIVDAFDEEKLHGFVLLYENKNTQELREFFVKFDEAEVESFMAGKRKVMQEALTYETTGEFPQCRCDPRKKSALCQAVPFFDE